MIGLVAKYRPLDRTGVIGRAGGAPENGALVVLQLTDSELQLGGNPEYHK